MTLSGHRPDRNPAVQPQDRQGAWFDILDKLLALADEAIE
jgi:hypothetical protein